MTTNHTKELEALYIKVRAGKDPDTGELHITEKDFIAQLQTLISTIERESRLDEHNKVMDKFTELVENAFFIWSERRLAQLKEVKG